MSLSERTYRLRCIELEAELAKLQKKVEDDDALPIILEVLDHYPGAREELIERLEVMDLPPTATIRDTLEDPVTMSDDELERRVRAILAKRDRERAEGEL